MSLNRFSDCFPELATASQLCKAFQVRHQAALTRARRTCAGGSRHVILPAEMEQPAAHKYPSRSPCVLHSYPRSPLSQNPRHVSIRRHEGVCPRTAHPVVDPNSDARWYSLSSRVHDHALCYISHISFCGLEHSQISAIFEWKQGRHWKALGISIHRSRRWELHAAAFAWECTVNVGLQQHSRSLEGCCESDFWHENFLGSGL